ncbi:hypothetical protein CK203_043644 [Vitis vinifera]|uniref:Retrotransposon gag domain-containing protein n=1 Tax=Vitis vinifera TaxID=29760 RepID=A0A438HYK6_VITVI|nr:hypothetical protein CK203_043644 [Vitis vinifera]
MPREVRTSLHYGGRARLRSGHSKGSMSGSNVEETSEQTRGRKIKPTAWGRGRKDKSRDAIANMEARLAKVELAMVDTREGGGLDRARHGEGLRGSKGSRFKTLIRGARPTISAGVTRGVHVLPRQARVMATHEAPRVEVPKPHTFSDKKDPKELENFLWHVECYFEAIALTDEATKVRTATLYLTDNATLWWHRRQFYPEDVTYLARKNMKRLKHTGSIREYVKEFSTLMLETPNMSEEELLFNLMDNFQSWAEQKGDSSKPKPRSKGNHAKAGETRDQGGTLLKKDQARDYPKRKALNAMIKEKEKEGNAHVRSLQLLNALKAKSVPKTPQSKGLMYVEALVNGMDTKALVDTGATHNFV